MRTFKERREMSKKRQALSSNKIMDLTDRLLFNNAKSPPGKEEKGSKSNDSPHKSASPVLDEVEVNQNIG